MQTLRELANRALVERVVLGGREELQIGPDFHQTIIWWLEAEGIADLNIIEGAAVALDLKAGVRALFRENEHAAFDDISGTEQMQYYGHLKAILAACMPGIIVPDEVGVVEVDPGDEYHGDPAQVLLNDVDITGRRVVLLPKEEPTITRKPPVNIASAGQREEE